MFGGFPFGGGQFGDALDVPPVSYVPTYNYTATVPGETRSATVKRDVRTAVVPADPRMNTRIA